MAKLTDLVDQFIANATFMVSPEHREVARRELPIAIAKMHQRITEHGPPKRGHLVSYETQYAIPLHLVEAGPGGLVVEWAEAERVHLLHEDKSYNDFRDWTLAFFYARIRGDKYPRARFPREVSDFSALGGVDLRHMEPKNIPEVIRCMKKHRYNASHLEELRKRKEYRNASVPFDESLLIVPKETFELGRSLYRVAVPNSSFSRAAFDRYQRTVEKHIPLGVKQLADAGAFYIGVVEPGREILRNARR